MDLWVQASDFQLLLACPPGCYNSSDTSQRHLQCAMGTAILPGAQVKFWYHLTPLFHPTLNPPANPTGCKLCPAPSPFAHGPAPSPRAPSGGHLFPGLLASVLIPLVPCPPASDLSLLLKSLQ